ncbi:hypothetical protein YN1551_0890 [Sulfolobus islandicus Y.N.15.51]|uniref:Uncharacterized protein n=1 Tax=Saccharolobus islandicus (strain Y.N.15.51 / Yellowstone \|nr:hypothetical protein YN1551_0890 [Sulfolobus islandicus Y.N.15.51]
MVINYAKNINITNILENLNYNVDQMRMKRIYKFKIL